MEPKNKDDSKEENKDDKTFYDRPFENVEDGYIDERGFYTTPNGSFWDDDHNYFNHLGFDIHGGTYDKFGVYHPGPNYDQETGLYKDQQELYNEKKDIDLSKVINHTINNLKKQQKIDKKVIKKYEIPINFSDSNSDDIPEENEKSESDSDYNNEKSYSSNKEHAV